MLSFLRSLPSYFTVKIEFVKWNVCCVNLVELKAVMKKLLNMLDFKMYIPHSYYINVLV